MCRRAKTAKEERKFNILNFFRQKTFDRREYQHFLDGETYQHIWMMKDLSLTFLQSSFCSVVHGDLD